MNKKVFLRTNSIMLVNDVIWTLKSIKSENHMEIKLRNNRLSTILLKPGVLKISASKCFSRKVEDQPHFMITSPIFYDALITVYDRKETTKWKLQIIFKNEMEKFEKVVFERSLNPKDAKRIANYIKPFIPLLGNSEIELKTKYLYSVLS